MLSEVWGSCSSSSLSRNESRLAFSFNCTFSSLSPLCSLNASLLRLRLTESGVRHPKRAVTLRSLMDR